MVARIVGSEDTCTSILICQLYYELVAWIVIGLWHTLHPNTKWQTSLFYNCVVFVSRQIKSASYEDSTVDTASITCPTAPTPRRTESSYAYGGYRKLSVYIHKKRLSYKYISMRISWAGEELYAGCRRTKHFIAAGVRRIETTWAAQVGRSATGDAREHCTEASTLRGGHSLAGPG